MSYHFGTNLRTSRKREGAKRHHNNTLVLILSQNVPHSSIIISKFSQLWRQFLVPHIWTDFEQCCRSESPLDYNTTTIRPQWASYSFSNIKDTFSMIQRKLPYLIFFYLQPQERETHTEKERERGKARLQLTYKARHAYGLQVEHASSKGT